MRRRQRHANRRSGAVAVETAFSVVILVTFMFVIFEYGRFLMVRHILDNAAREGCRLAVVSTNAADPLVGNPNPVPPNPDIVIRDRITDYMANQTIHFTSWDKTNSVAPWGTGNGNIDIYRSDAAGNAMTDSVGRKWTNAAVGDRIAVKVTANYVPMLPTFSFLSNPQPISTTVVMRSYGN